MNKFNLALAYITSLVGTHREEDKGASALEYAVLVVAIVAAVTAAVAVFAADLLVKFGTLVP